MLKVQYNPTENLLMFRSFLSCSANKKKGGSEHDRTQQRQRACSPISGPPGAAGWPRRRRVGSRRRRRLAHKARPGGRGATPLRRRRGPPSPRRPLPGPTRRRASAPAAAGRPRGPRRRPRGAPPPSGLQPAEPPLRSWRPWCPGTRKREKPGGGVNGGHRFEATAWGHRGRRQLTPAKPSARLLVAGQFMAAKNQARQS
jgi:hypothetical protein